MSMTIKGMGAGVMPDRHPVAERPKRPPPQPQNKSENRLDGHAALSVKEQLKARIAGINQAVQAAETAMAMIQTAGKGLNQCEEWLTALRRAILQAKEAHKPRSQGSTPRSLDDREAVLEESRRKIRQALSALERQAHQTRFGPRPLLDGSLDSNGMALGDGLYFVAAAIQTRSSPAEGWPVWIERVGGPAQAIGASPLLPDHIRRQVELRIEEADRMAFYQAKPHNTTQEVLDGLRASLDENQLEVMADLRPDGRLWAVHRKKGSRYGFTLSSSIPGLFSGLNGQPVTVFGSDTVGHINGEPAMGLGPWLVSREGTPLEGLKVYVRPPGTAQGLAPSEPSEGRLFLAQGGITLTQGSPGGVPFTVRLPSVRPSHLARGIDTPSAYGCLEEVKVDTPEETRDSQEVVEAALQVIEGHQKRLSHGTRSIITGVMHAQKVELANLLAAESVISNSGFALEMADYLHWQLGVEAETALKAQPHPPPGSMLRLLSAQAKEPPKPGRSH